MQELVKQLWKINQTTLYNLLNSVMAQGTDCLLVTDSRVVLRHAFKYGMPVQPN